MRKKWTRITPNRDTTFYAVKVIMQKSFKKKKISGLMVFSGGIKIEHFFNTDFRKKRRKNYEELLSFLS